MKNAGRIPRHIAINETIKRALASVNVPSQLEPLGIYRQDGKKPDGLSLVPWSRGKSLLWDATCTDTLAKSYVKASSRSVGAAAALAETRKLNKYLPGVPMMFQFCPFAVETLGTFGESALRLVNELGKRLYLCTGEKRSRTFLIQRISIAIQRGNAASVLATIPQGPKFNEIFYL
jgi:hypothetical protein